MEKLKSKLNYYKEKGCNLNSEEVKKILYELENTQADLYEANNRINDLLDIVEQKDKEIEELKQNIHLKEVYVLKTNDYIKGTNVEDELCNKKWNDKIKAKIEEVKDGTFDAKIVLQSLLEKE